jgi:sulfite reductase alpha subunit-like flavoprotein
MNDQKTIKFAESRIKELSEHLISLTKEVTSLSEFLTAIKNESATTIEIESTTNSSVTENKTTNVPVTPKQPFFRGQSSDVHPTDFMRELEEFVSFFGATPEQQINLAISCLQGEARTFARAFRYKFNTFGEFKFSFLEQFWGIHRQRKVRHKLENGAYEAKKGNSHMADYFLRWVAMIRTFHVVPSTTTFLNEISRHFPIEVQNSLRAYGDGTIETALLILEEEDELLNRQKSRMTKRPRKQHECWRMRRREADCNPTAAS